MCAYSMSWVAECPMRLARERERKGKVEYVSKLVNFKIADWQLNSVQDETRRDENEKLQTHL